MKNKIMVLCAIIFISKVMGESLNKYTPENGYNDANFHANGEENFLRRHLTSNTGIVFDVGANIGDWSSAAIQFAPNAHVYAFEPHPLIFKILRRKMGRTIACHQFALSDVEKEIELWVWGDEKDINSSVLNGLYYRPLLKDLLDKTPTKVPVHAMSLDNFCQQNNIEHIDFLKIDTEGSEWDVLKGSDQMITHRRIDIIQFEYGGCYVDSNTKLEWIYQYLTKNGYSIFRILPNGLLPIPTWDSELENYQYSNYAAILSE